MFHLLTWGACGALWAVFLLINGSENVPDFIQLGLAIALAGFAFMASVAHYVERMYREQRKDESTESEHGCHDCAHRKVSGGEEPCYYCSPRNFRWEP